MDDHDKFSLRPVELIMETAQGMPDRPRKIILYKWTFNTDLCISFLVECLPKHPSGIAVQIRLYDDEARKLCIDDSHESKVSL
jgi:hypothetical protein